MTRASEHNTGMAKAQMAAPIPAMGLFGRSGAASVVNADQPRPKAPKGRLTFTAIGQRAA